MSTSEPRGQHRFRRALTARELSAIEQAMRQEGGAAGFKALWSVILTEAEGVTWEEAVARGLRFRPADYAIPSAQADQLLTLMTTHRGPSDKPINASMTWLNEGPASFED